MTLHPPFDPAAPAQSADPATMGSLFEALVQGGPVMIPLAICSVAALTWTFERWIRLRPSALGDRALGESLVAALREGGPSQALAVLRAKRTVLTAIYEPVLQRWHEGRSLVEKAAEDFGSRELRGLGTALRPLTVIALLAPLLGLLGTVIGIILAFRDIGTASALGRPEALSVGIAQALVTTAAGLVIAIPTQAIYFWFRTKIDRFSDHVEEVGEALLALHGSTARTDAPPPPPASAVATPIVAPAATPVFAAAPSACN